MFNNFINSQIKRTTKNLFVVNLIILIISIVVLAYNWSEFHNIIIGPKEVKVGEISNFNISGISARNYVKVKPEKVTSTGLQYVQEEHQNNGETNKVVESVYYVFKDGKNLLIAAIPPDKADRSSYNGWVREMTSEEKDKLNEDISKLKSLGYTVNEEYILDVEKSSAAPFLYGIFGIIIIINIINILRSIKYNNYPEKHKIYKKLMKYGNVDQVISSIEEELNYDSFPDSKKIYLLKSWILTPSFLSLGVNKIDDIVWAYKKITRHSVNFIPTGKTYELVLCFCNKTQRLVTLKDNQINYLLTSIKKQYPWIIIGYNKDLKRMWKSNFPKLINYVQAEKQRTTDNQL